jgi:hypothetical protein
MDRSRHLLVFYYHRNSRVFRLLLKQFTRLAPGFFCLFFVFFYPIIKANLKRFLFYPIQSITHHKNTPPPGYLFQFALLLSLSHHHKNTFLFFGLFSVRSLFEKNLFIFFSVQIFGEFPVQKSTPLDLEFKSP